MINLSETADYDLDLEILANLSREPELTLIPPLEKDFGKISMEAFLRRMSDLGVLIEKRHLPEALHLDGRRGNTCHVGLCVTRHTWPLAQRLARTYWNKMDYQKGP